jgi:hypothetical protein
MRKLINQTKNRAAALWQQRGIRRIVAGNLLLIAAQQAYASAGGFSLPLSGFFCSLASALQSQWAPGIILIVIIIEAFLFLVVKKGVLQMMMIVVIAASMALGAGSFLNLIKPNSACATVS